MNSNCRGSRGKQGLNPSKLAAVKGYTFKLYPTPPGLKDQQWGKCVIAIDDFLRCRKKKDATADIHVCILICILFSSDTFVKYMFVRV